MTSILRMTLCLSLLTGFAAACGDGTEVALETIHYDRGHDIPDPGPQQVLRLRMV